ncbi:hypothetical protein [Sulfuricurvum sp.]|uniref:hypothetical protein n=1 Tax=Sulfuricurvum sp. TaxID=2025608 RepID=UPI00262D8C93|nr:hypothetical protein [Sulfuricurvum sp.]MDD2266042.1 hypothetical protein [Sulfuricurvum sp.]MDD2783054.1 hypothetical protein [Sulfuricurvum sp.]
MHSNRLAIIAKTFTPYYSEREDRIRLVINYADYPNRVDFWITRAFLLKLLPSWEDYLYRHGNAKNFASAKSLDNSRSGPSATDGGTLVVMEKEAVLLDGVDMTFNSGKGVFEIRLRGRGAVTLAELDDRLMMAVIRSIFAAAPHLHWGISPALLES